MIDRAFTIISKNILIFILFLVSACNRNQRFDLHVKNVERNLKDKNYQRALTEANEAIKLQPDTILVYLLRGEVYYHLHDYRLSQKDFRKAVKL
jgi:Tfp pilus assembly protein PilF